MRNLVVLTLAGMLELAAACSDPLQEGQEGKTIDIPRVCKEVKSLNHGFYSWSLTCSDVQGNDRFYFWDVVLSKGWEEYHLDKK